MFPIDWIYLTNWTGLTDLTDWTKAMIRAAPGPWSRPATSHITAMVVSFNSPLFSIPNETRCLDSTHCHIEPLCNVSPAGVGSMGQNPERPGTWRPRNLHGCGNSFTLQADEAFQGRRGHVAQPRD